MFYIIGTVCPVVVSAGGSPAYISNVSILVVFGRPVIRCTC